MYFYFYFSISLSFSVIKDAALISTFACLVVAYSIVWTEWDMSLFRERNLEVA